MVAFPAPGSPQPLPKQDARLLPPGAGAVLIDPSQPTSVPNNIMNALYSCAASEIEQQRIIDSYWKTFPSQGPKPVPKDPPP